MALTEITPPPETEIRQILSESGRVRLSELVERTDIDPTRLRISLVRLVENGEASLLTIGHEVVVRYEL